MWFKPLPQYSLYKWFFYHLIIQEFKFDKNSAAQSQNSWVAQRTIHDGSLSGPCYFWVVRIWCDQKWKLNNNIVMRYLFSTSKKQKCVRLIFQILLSLGNLTGGSAANFFRKFISRETDDPTCNYGSPVTFMGRILRPGDRLWTAL